MILRIICLVITIYAPIVSNGKHRSTAICAIKQWIPWYQKFYFLKLRIWIIDIKESYSLYQKLDTCHLKRMYRRPSTGLTNIKSSSIDRTATVDKIINLANGSAMNNENCLIAQSKHVLISKPKLDIWLLVIAHHASATTVIKGLNWILLLLILKVQVFNCRSF